MVFVSGMWHRGMKTHKSSPYMGDGAISASRNITVLSSSFHNTALQRSEKRTRWLLDRKSFWDFPAPLSQEMRGWWWFQRVEGHTVCPSICVYAHALKCMWVYLLAHIFMWVHVLGEHTCVYAFICVEVCVQPCVCGCVHMDAVHNLRCHPRTLFFLGFKWEPLTHLDLT